jgi:hypothetical protein
VELPAALGKAKAKYSALKQGKQLFDSLSFSPCGACCLCLILFSFNLYLPETASLTKDRAKRFRLKIDHQLKLIGCSTGTPLVLRLSRILST